MNIKTIDDIADLLYKASPDIAEELANAIFSYRDGDLEHKDKVSKATETIVAMLINYTKEDD